MIVLIIVWVSLTFQGTASGAFSDNLLMYKDAFHYIVSKKDEIMKIDKVFKVDSMIIKVSEQLITYSPKYFIDDIIQKDFYNIDDSTRTKVTKVLESFPESSFSSERIKELSELSESENYNFVLFFSQEAGHNIIADMRLFRKDFGMNYEDYARSYTGCNFVFYFWFNDYDEIDKVIYKLICK